MTKFKDDPGGIVQTVRDLEGLTVAVESRGISGYPIELSSEEIIAPSFESATERLSKLLPVLLGPESRLVRTWEKDRAFYCLPRPSFP
jgi:hypothetical protein